MAIDRTPGWLWTCLCARFMLAAGHKHSFRSCPCRTCLRSGPHQALRCLFGSLLLVPCRPCGVLSAWRLLVPCHNGLWKVPYQRAHDSWAARTGLLLALLRLLSDCLSKREKVLLSWQESLLPPQTSRRAGEVVVEVVVVQSGK